jgi:hypothetical protein
MKVAAFTSNVQMSGVRCQVSGVRCQQLKSIRWIGVDEMDFLSPVLNFSRNPNLLSESGNKK